MNKICAPVSARVGDRTPRPGADRRWTRLRDVRCPIAGHGGHGGSGWPRTVPLSEVVIGPSGVHVVLEHAAVADETARVLVAEAVTAAEAVASQLPRRYRCHVVGAVRLEGDGEVGGLVESVLVATGATLRDAIWVRPRVLSSSEVAAISAHLTTVLVPKPPQMRARCRWLRLLRPGPARRVTGSRAAA